MGGQKGKLMTLLLSCLKLVNLSLLLSFVFGISRNIESIESILDEYDIFDDQTNFEDIFDEKALDFMGVNEEEGELGIEEWEEDIVGSNVVAASAISDDDEENRAFFSQWDVDFEDEEEEEGEDDDFMTSIDENEKVGD